jgi:hypothetical protein
MIKIFFKAKMIFWLNWISFFTFCFTSRRKKDKDSKLEARSSNFLKRIGWKLDWDYNVTQTFLSEDSFEHHERRIFGDNSINIYLNLILFQEKNMYTESFIPRKINGQEVFVQSMRSDLRIQSRGSQQSISQQNFSFLFFYFCFFSFCFFFLWGKSWFDCVIFVFFKSKQKFYWTFLLNNLKEERKRYKKGKKNLTNDFHNFFHFSKKF